MTLGSRSECTYLIANLHGLAIFHTRNDEPPPALLRAVVGAVVRDLS